MTPTGLVSIVAGGWIVPTFIGSNNDIDTQQGHYSLSRKEQHISQHLVTSDYRPVTGD